MTQAVLHWEREGRGPTVVLSHPLGCSMAMWDGVAARLKDHFTVLRYDHRGHGRSETPPGPYTLQMLADDAAGLIAAQASGPVHFVGLSMIEAAHLSAVEKPEKTRGLCGAGAGFPGCVTGVFPVPVMTVD